MVISLGYIMVSVARNMNYNGKGKCKTMAWCALTYLLSTIFLKIRGWLVWGVVQSCSHAPTRIPNLARKPLPAQLRTYLNHKNTISPKLWEPIFDSSAQCNNVDNRFVLEISYLCTQWFNVDFFWCCCFCSFNADNGSCRAIRRISLRKIEAKK